jgi:hypothetical protein
MLYKVCCLSSNKDYVSQLSSSGILFVVFSNVDKWLAWPLLDRTTTLVTQLLCPLISHLNCRLPCHSATTVQVQVQVQVILRPTVSRPVLPGVMSLLERVTRCYISLSDNYLVLFFHIGRPLWREDGSVISSIMTQIQFQVILRPTVCRPVRL